MLKLSDYYHSHVPSFALALSLASSLFFFDDDDGFEFNYLRRSLPRLKKIITFKAAAAQSKLLVLRLSRQ